MPVIPADEATRLISVRFALIKTPITAPICQITAMVWKAWNESL